MRNTDIFKEKTPQELSRYATLVIELFYETIIDLVKIKRELLIAPYRKIYLLPQLYSKSDELFEEIENKLENSVFRIALLSILPEKYAKLENDKFIKIGTKVIYILIMTLVDKYIERHLNQHNPHLK